MWAHNFPSNSIPIIKPSTKALTNNQMLRNEKIKNAKQEVEKLRSGEYKSRLVWKIYEIGWRIHEVTIGKDPLS